MTVTADAEISRPITLDDLLDVELVEDCALSPDGRFLAVLTQRSADHEEGPARWVEGLYLAPGRIRVIDVASGKEEECEAPDGRAGRLSWSPDGRFLAYYATESGEIRVGLWDRVSATSRLVADAAVCTQRLDRDRPAWLGGRLIVPVRDAAAEPPRPPESDDREGASGIRVYSTNAVPGAADELGGRELTKAASPDVASIDPETGTVELVLTDHSFEIAYPSPDGRWLAVMGRPRQSGVGDPVFRRQLWVLADGGVPELVTELTLFGLGMRAFGGGIPAWSPNGSRLAFFRDGCAWIATPGDPTRHERLAFGESEPVTAGLTWNPDGSGLVALTEPTDAGVWPPVEPELWWIPTDTAVAPTRLDLPPHRAGHEVLCRRETSWFWAPRPDTLAVATTDPETKRSEIWLVPLDGGAASLFFAEDALVSPFDISADGKRAAFGLQRMDQPTELFAIDGADPSSRIQVTNLNGWLESFELGRPTLVSWTTTEGERCRGAVLLPPGFDPGADEPVPTVVGLYVGHPMSDSFHRWGASLGILDIQLLAGLGIAVLLPDIPSAEESFSFPRGGHAGAVLPGVDELIRLGITDPDRLGVMGQSAGGYSVNRLVTQTARFKAAVSAAGVSDLASLYGHLELTPAGAYLDFWGNLSELWAGGKPADAPLGYIDASPIFHLDRVTTPLLIIHGDADTIVPVNQARELFVGLLRNEKEAVLVEYRGEGHVPSIFSSANRADVVERVMSWFDTKLVDGSPGRC